MNKREKHFLEKVILFLAVVCMLGSVVACKKEKGEQKDDITPTMALPEIQGFEAANKELVREMAEKYAQTVAVSVGDEKIAMDKAIFLIYSMEVRWNYYASNYELQYGTSYWDTVYDEEGHTVRDIVKQETMDVLIQYAVFYDCAIKNGMSLTAEEIEENNAYVERIIEELTAEETERGGFTEEGLRSVCEWMMLAEKYYDKMTDGLGVTRESVSETINKEDYKEYETEYIFLSTTYYDENYELQEESDEVKEAYTQQMADYYDEVLEGITFEELATGESALLHEKRTFLVDGNGAEEAYIKAAEELKVGEISKPVQTEYGIYLIKMLDDECTDSYEAAVDAAYEVERSEAFTAAYEVLLSEYQVEVNEAVWGEVLLGATVSLLE